MQVAFYAFFASVLYPASAVLHPHGFYSRMAPMVPLGLHGLLKVILCDPCCRNQNPCITAGCLLNDCKLICRL